jgi:cob(I)alamin adenosyltransferase
MKIYTKTGDQGYTSLFNGTRVPKHHIRIESYGTVDELNSYLGLIADQNINPHHKNLLKTIQSNLFTLGAVLATDPEKAEKGRGLNIDLINTDDIQILEDEMDKMDAQLPAMTNFILPGGHQTVSFCHIARCVCRRAERMTTALNEISPVQPEVISYLNRLSDYLFVLARLLTKELQADEIKWIAKKSDNN